jgi:hypothetical protein
MAQETITAFAANGETPEKGSSDTATGSQVSRPDEFEDWTPKQKENWKNHGQPVFERIESEKARKLYLRTYRPKKRNDGMMKRDEVSFGDVEHYVDKEIEDTFNPMGSMQGVIMARMGVPRDQRDEIDELVDEIIRAKVGQLAEDNPDAAKRLLSQTKRVAELYGAI